jgi:hypothetical protein
MPSGARRIVALLNGICLFSGSPVPDSANHDFSLQLLLETPILGPTLRKRPMRLKESLLQIQLAKEKEP